MGERVIRVMLVDDHQLVRTSLRQVLALDPALEVVAEAGDALTALAMVADVRPDVVLMDVHMPGVDGIAATRSLLEVAPDACVVMLSSSCTLGQVRAALEAGARGYLVKDMDISGLWEAVHEVAAGGRVLAPLARSLVSLAPEGTWPR